MITIPKKEGSEEKGMSLTQVAKHYGIGYSLAYRMYSNGCRTLQKMDKYRAEVKAGKHTGGCPESLKKTSKGNMTVAQIVEKHPHDLNAGAIWYRGYTWGFDHKCLWLKKMPPKQFTKAAIALDGVPRGVNSDIVTSVDKPPIPDKKLEFDRSIVCIRGEGFIKQRCDHAEARLNMIGGLPDVCQAAHGRTCKNYTFTEEQ